MGRTKLHNATPAVVSNESNGASKSSVDVLTKFLNGKHLDERRILKYSSDFDSAVPFRFLELRDFLLHPSAVALKRAVVDLDFELKKSDLFEFFQSGDLMTLSKGVISDFTTLFMSAPFRAYMMSITGIDLSHSEITLFGSRYEDTSYLLPHDDQLEGRQIAFLYYLSDMNENNGGELVLFGKMENDEVVSEKVRIRPHFNSFVFFEVTPASIHAVSEVIGTGERYTLGGWFVLKGTQKAGEYL